jgi:hypothetical protein
MTRAEAYTLAQSRGFDKSITVFGSKFTTDPDVVVCGIRREGRGFYVDTLIENTSTVTLENKEQPINAEKIPESEIILPKNSYSSTFEPISTESNSSAVKDSEPESEEQNESKEQKDPENQDKPARIRRKIYTANGTHQAICRFQGILMPKPDDDKGFKLLLPGLEIDASFAFPKTAWFYRKCPEAFEGVKNYIGYPRMTREGKLVKVYIVSVDQQQNFKKEQWEFVGMWCGPQKSLFIQRRSDMFPEDPRPHYYKFRFKNQDEYKKYLWDRYAYQIIAKREGDELLIVRNNPFACPRRKPEPPQFKGKVPYGKPGEKPAFNKPKKD